MIRPLPRRATAHGSQSGALLIAALLLAPFTARDDGLFPPTTFVARAAHFGTSKGGDVGDMPELPSFRRAGSNDGDGEGGAPGIETQFAAQHGLVAIGMVAELLNELQRAFCDQTGSGGRGYKCAEYEDSRRRLWQTFADDYLCGLDPGQWAGGLRVRDLPIQEQFEYLLSQCDSAWVGDLVEVVRTATELFLAQSTLNRPDIKAVVIANDAKAGRRETLPTDDLYTIHPGLLEHLAPVTTLLREPAVVTWKVEVDLDDHTPYAEGGEPREAALRAREGSLLAEAGSTEQYPALFGVRMSKGAPAQALYRDNYLPHPSPLSGWDQSYCAARDVDSDPLCFPRVTPQLGYTHDAEGRRLLTNQGGPLPAGYEDPNV